MISLSSFAQAEAIILKKSDIIQVQPSVWTAPAFEIPQPKATLPIVGPSNTQDGARLLRLYFAQGKISGLAGVVYDNRDRDHSSLSNELYPRLTHLKYGEGLVTDGLDFGLAGQIMLPAVVLGNSSTAMRRGVQARSLPRLAMTTPFWSAAAANLYANNHIYVYPEHRDFDRADLFPVNWPYMIVSQGSSRSDQRFLNAVALTLAALPSDTFAFLRENGLIAPTVQMILRRNLANVSTREDYLSGVAHPSAFYGPLARTGRMVEQAASMRPSDVPPVVRLRVVEDGFAETAGLAGRNERFLDSPAAIGRLWRGFTWEREMVVTASDTTLLNGQPVNYSWKLLRGDPERVTITPQGVNGQTAKIRIAWHDPWIEASPGKKGPVERKISRVDIGVFANNGVNDSAPSFISVDFPEHQIREYATGSDGKPRLLSVDYNAIGRSAYFDPVLYWTAKWTDVARYDSSGVLLGWNRTNADGIDTGFVLHDPDAVMALHKIVPSKKGLPVLYRVNK